METQTDEILCDSCGRNGARIIHVSKSYGQGADLLVIENVPVVSCPHCGMSYLTAQTLHTLEHMKLDRAQVAVERPFPVAVFA